MIKLTKGVGFTTDSNGSIEEFKMEFDKSDLEKIKKCQALIKEHDFQAIEIDFCAEIEHDGDFTEGVSWLKVFNDCVYFNVQSKYTAEIQYESEQITNEELGL